MKNAFPWKSQYVLKAAEIRPLSLTEVTLSVISVNSFHISHFILQNAEKRAINIAFIKTLTPLNNPNRSFFFTFNHFSSLLP